MSPEELVAFTVRVRKPEREALQAMADRGHRTLNAEVRKAVVEAIERDTEERAA